MLPIVTLTSDAPIIIDQPEDNLDNRLVSRAIFKILSKFIIFMKLLIWHMSNHFRALPSGYEVAFGVPNKI